MNELSNWLSLPFLFILLPRRKMFVEFGFHRRLAISQFLDRLPVADHPDCLGWSATSPQTRERFYFSNACQISGMVSDYWSCMKTLISTNETSATVLAYYESSYFLAKVPPSPNKIAYESTKANKWGKGFYRFADWRIWDDEVMDCAFSPNLIEKNKQMNKADIWLERTRVQFLWCCNFLNRRRKKNFWWNMPSNQEKKHKY